MNSLNLIFGPRLPVELEKVGLAFISSPNLTPDLSIASLSSERYAPENYSHLSEDLALFSEGSSDSKKDLYVEWDVPGTSLESRIDQTPSHNVSGIITVDGRNWYPKVPMSPMQIAGLNITKANTWPTLVKPGNVWRPYTITSSEPSSSWLRRSGLIDNESVMLIYAVPEMAYKQTQAASGVIWPPSEASYIKSKEIVSATGPNTISYRGDLISATKITLNNVVIWSGNWNPGDTSDIILDHDLITKTLALSVSILPDDYVELEYLSYDQYYLYSGFRDYSNNWHPFNANPEYGNYIGDDRNCTLRPSSDCLLEQATLYALPCAYIKSNYKPDLTGNSLGELKLFVVRGFDWGETHFIRHVMGIDRQEKIQIRQGASTVSTWGEAKFGRNYYDEFGSYDTDVYSDLIPSMLPLGRIVLSAPTSVKSVQVADIRQRGGGVPMDFPMVAVETAGDGLDQIKSFYDLGIWEGKAIKEGGVVEVKISNSLLQNEGESDPTKFTAQQIYEIVESTMAPGIDWELKFVDEVTE